MMLMSQTAGAVSRLYSCLCLSFSSKLKSYIFVQPYVGYRSEAKRLTHVRMSILCFFRVRARRRTGGRALYQQCSRPLAHVQHVRLRTPPSNFCNLILCDGTRDAQANAVTNGMQLTSDSGSSGLVLQGETLHELGMFAPIKRQMDFAIFANRSSYWLKSNHKLHACLKFGMKKDKKDSRIKHRY